MVVARSLTDVVDHEVDGARFQLRMLPHRVMLRIGDLTGSQQVELIIRAGIAGWSGIKLSNGSELKSETATELMEGVTIKDALTLDCFEALPFTMLGDLSTSILAANSLLNDEVGNS